MNAFSSSKRILSLDYGTVRIGVALSDESLTLATPLCVVDNTRGESNALDKILVLTQKHNTGTVVIGLPFHADGTDSPMTVRVRAFAERVREKTGLTVELCDERYSSMEAQETLIAGGKTRKARRKKGELDKRAAAIILQDYLDGRKH